MQQYRIFKLLCLVTIASLLVGCSGRVLQTIDESERDTAGVYNGEWFVKVTKGAPVQRIDNWIFTCGDMSRVLKIIVEDGSVYIAEDKNKNKAYVSRDGKFKLKVRLSQMAEASAGSGSAIVDGKRTFILQGSLKDKKRKGYVTYGVAQFGNNGCTAKAHYLPI